MNAMDDKTVDRLRTPPQITKTQQGVAYVTTVRTWFVDLTNFASQCTDDYQSSNAWKSLAVVANGILEEIIGGKKDIPDQYKQEIAALKKEWDSGDVTRVEKTKMTAQDRGGKRITSASWDSYTAECFPEGLALMLEYIHKEKYNNMAAKLCVWCGRCARIFFGMKMISIDDRLTEPFQPTSDYDENRLRKDMERRRKPSQLIRPQAPEAK